MLIRLLPIMSVLGIRRELQIVLAHIAPAVPAEVVIVITVNRQYGLLLTIRIVCTEISMNMQIFETVNLVVCLNVTYKRTGIRTIILVSKSCCRVTCRLCIGRIRPRIIVVARRTNYALIVTVKPVIQNVLCYQHFTVGVYCLTLNRHRRIHRQSSTDYTGGIAVVDVHSLGVDIECQMVVQERRAQVHRGCHTLHL